MPIAPYLLALQGLPEINKLFTSARQRKEARELEGVSRPKYEIPKAITDYSTMTKYMASAGMGGKGQGVRNLDRAGASAANTAVKLGRGNSAQLSSLVDANQATKQGISNLDAQEAQIRERRMQDVYQSDRVLGQYQEQAQQFNVIDPYMQAKAAESAYRESAMRNFQTGMEGLSDTAITGFMLKDQRPDLFGTGGRGTNSTTPTSGSTTPTFQGANQVVLPPQGGYSVSPYEVPSMEQMYPTQSPYMDLGGGNPMAADYFSQISAGNNVNSLNAFGANAPNNYTQGAMPSQGGYSTGSDDFPTNERIMKFGNRNPIANNYFTGLSGDETYNNPLIGDNVSQKSARNYNLDNIFGRAARNVSNYFGYLKMRR